MKNTIVTITFVFSLLMLASCGGDTSEPIDGGQEIQTFSLAYGGIDYEEGNALQQAQDGGYIIIGTTYSYGAGESDMYLIKTDSTGIEQWARTFGGADYEQGNSVQKTSDGGYILLGSTKSYGAGSYDFYLVKTDEYGNEEWFETFGSTGNDVGFSVQETSDGGFVLWGSRDSALFLIKTNKDGLFLWEQSYGSSDFESAKYVQETSEGGFLLIWNEYGDPYKFGLAKTDEDGALQWTRTFSSALAQSLKETEDGDYILLGTQGRFDGLIDVGMYLLKIDSEGNTLWEKTLPSATNSYGNSIALSSDENFLLAGYSTSSENGYDINLVKTSDTGDIIWEFTFGGSEEDFGVDIIEDTNKNIIVLGETRSFGAGNKDIYLLKVNEDGQFSQ